jgi:Rod binding domain-containing protein
MAIAISTDLVLDVVRAANPDRVRVAQASLGTATGGTEATQQFAEAVNFVQQKSGIGRFLSSDIVGDVVNAADPGQRQGGILKLAGVNDPAQIDMSSVVVAANDENGVGGAAANKKKVAYQQFEAGVLRNFVEEMLPKSSDTLYGEGTAGNVWRSMQADYMSQELAKSGGIGIASTLARLDEQKAGNQSGASLNELPQRTPAGGNSISNANEWPYFSRGEIGVLQS